uniref:DUF6816 domain-containing protein n=1 Tax=Chlamydomonas leiostraca TaxID=1034604 RepID=A0A7S0RZ19_9CHLO
MNIRPQIQTSACVHSRGGRFSRPVVASAVTRRDVLWLSTASAAVASTGAAGAQPVLPSSSQPAWLPAGGPAASQLPLPFGSADSTLQGWLSGPPNTAAIANPGLSWALGQRDKQLYYPAWMQGTWRVRASFKGAGFPLGPRFISRAVPGATKASMIVALSDVGAAMEAPIEFSMRFTASAEEGGVVADRVYNTAKQADTMLGYPAVRRVEYSPLDNPTRMSVVYATPRRAGAAPAAVDPLAGPDGQRQDVDLRKAEIFINNRISTSIDRCTGGSAAGTGAPGEGDGSTSQGQCEWVACELYRQVSQAARQGSVGDYMSVWRYTLLDRGSDAAGAGARVSCQMRVAAFLQPQDPLFFETGGKAVAVYDYVLDLTRTA